MEHKGMMYKHLALVHKALHKNYALVHKAQGKCAAGEQQSQGEPKGKFGGSWES